MQQPTTEIQNKVSWKYVILFYAIAFSLSAPFNSFYFLEEYQNLTAGTIFYKSGFLLAGLGTLIAGLLALRLDGKLYGTISTFWGNAKSKNLIIAIIPLIVFTIVGMPNDLHQNNHLYAFRVSLLLTLYALSEEIFWRGYLINALSPLGKFKNYLLLGILWWAWHFPFTRGDGYTTFLLLVVGSSFLIAKFVEGTRSWLTAAGLHALIVITTIGDNERPLLYAGGAVILIWILIGTFWKTPKTGTEQLS